MAKFPTSWDDAAPVTASDTAPQEYDLLHVGTAGAVRVKTRAGKQRVITTIADNIFLPVGVSMVYSTGTTASNITGYMG